MPANKYALIRYRVIDRVIGNKYNPYPSMEDLMEACSEAIGKQVSKSTIEKDIYAMKNDMSLGYEAPIKYSKNYQGYFYEDPDFTIRDVPLSDEEVDAIQFAAKTLFQFKNIPIFRQYETAIDKILDRIIVGDELKGEQQKFIQFENLPTTRGNEHLEQLLSAIQHKKVVAFDYKSYKKAEGKRRIVDPYLLKEYRHRWYLIGYSEEKQSVIVYGLDRMKNVELLDETYEVTESFNPDLFFKHSIGITVGEGGAQKIELSCSPVLSKYLKSQPLHHSQTILKEDENGTVFQYLLTQTYELEERILGFGAEAKVLKPNQLRDSVKSSLKSAYKRYE